MSTHKARINSNKNHKKVFNLSFPRISLSVKTQNIFSPPAGLTFAANKIFIQDGSVSQEDESTRQSDGGKGAKERETVIWTQRIRLKQEGHLPNVKYHINNMNPKDRKED